MALAHSFGCAWQVLQRLDLSETGLTYASVDALARLVSPGAGPPLAALCLAGNRLGGRGGRALAAALAGNAELQQLDVSHAGLGDEGAAAIALALLRNDHLMDLDLAANQVRHRSVNSPHGISHTESSRFVDDSPSSP